jgi:amidase
VRDAAAVLDVLAGPMPGDPYTAPGLARPLQSEVGADPGRLRIGLRTAALANLCDVDAQCVTAAEDAARVLESLGHTVEVASPAAADEGELIGLFLTIVATNTLFIVEQLSEMAGRPVTADDVEPGTWALAEAGRAVTALQCLQTLDAAHAWSRRMLSWWDGGYDLLLTPTLAAPPPRLGVLNDPKGDPAMGPILQTPYAAFVAAFNVTGQPAISIPFTTSADNTPIGVQLVGRAYDEATLVQVASQMETAHPWADRRPAASTPSTAGR